MIARLMGHTSEGSRPHTTKRLELESDCVPSASQPGDGAEKRRMFGLFSKKQGENVKKYINFLLRY